MHFVISFNKVLCICMYVYMPLICWKHMALHKLALVALLIDWLMQWYNVRWYAENVQAVELLPHLLILPSSVSKVSFVLYDVVSVDQLFPSRNEFIFCFLLLCYYMALCLGEPCSEWYHQSVRPIGAYQSRQQRCRNCNFGRNMVFDACNTHFEA